MHVPFSQPSIHYLIIAHIIDHTQQGLKIQQIHIPRLQGKRTGRHHVRPVPTTSLVPNRDSQVLTNVQYGLRLRGTDDVARQRPQTGRLGVPLPSTYASNPNFESDVNHADEITPFWGNWVRSSKRTKTGRKSSQNATKRPSKCQTPPNQSEGGQNPTMGVSGFQTPSRQNGMKRDAYRPPHTTVPF